MKLECLRHKLIREQLWQNYCLTKSDYFFLNVGFFLCVGHTAWRTNSIGRRAPRLLVWYNLHILYIWEIWGENTCQWVPDNIQEIFVHLNTQIHTNLRLCQDLKRLQDDMHDICLLLFFRHSQRCSFVLLSQPGMLPPSLFILYKWLTRISPKHKF